MVEVAAVVVAGEGCDVVVAVVVEAGVEAGAGAGAAVVEEEEEVVVLELGIEAAVGVVVVVGVEVVALAAEEAVFVPMMKLVFLKVKSGPPRFKVYVLVLETR